MPLLELKHLSKCFGAVSAVSEFDLCIEPGQVIGLVGDNGAGKSTLIKMMAGNFAPSSGSILFQGRHLQLSSPGDARRAGIEVVYQDLALCENLSSAANVFLGRELTRGVGPLRRLDHAAMQQRSAVLLGELSSEAQPEQLVSSLSGGQRQAVAIARSLISIPKLLLLDEPTAAISVRQVTEVLSLIRTLCARGIALVFISHRLSDIFAVSDRIVAMRHGRKVADAKKDELSVDLVTRLITGTLERFE